MKLDVMANDIFVRTNEWGGRLAGMLSWRWTRPTRSRKNIPAVSTLLLFDPLDGSSNIDVNVAVGSIFSVLRCPQRSGALCESDFLQAGVTQVCAGYAIYGPATMLVLTTGRGVSGFTLDREIGEFMLTHPDLRIPENTSEFAHQRVELALLGAGGQALRQLSASPARDGPRGQDFNMRWIASLVAEAHRILMRGGVFMYPRDRKDLSKPGRLRLLYEANPIGMIIEQAGGRASTGYEPILGVVPEHLHQRIGLVFGARAEVEIGSSAITVITTEFEYEAPLFGSRSLLRDPA